MTPDRELILTMATKAGLSGGEYELMEFADLLSKHVLEVEREECAKVAEAHVDPEWPGDDLSRQAEAIAAEIRERGAA